ncbi:putative ATP-dependent RNA helicase DHX35 [Piptocephalis cylindrospora]|uniref:RNA helicase n=1 Tax=Piptocephalis cylindrospora TaxID=1907219 RepID=A0A4P9Y0L7_9FUNG|nr:putative ATP-dependent RNA helicase DHX35 [Piptocephalis cylindrospora]|eukprot:RKP12336.1 putative ATP-dependent RNA helicase DHX35 [Piptocephalis cylindrospora]
MAFWKPGTVGPGSEVERSVTETAQDLITSYNAATASRSLEHQRTTLPAYQKRKVILHRLNHSRVLILVGHTGSGKSTQIPQYLDEAGWATGPWMIACTQPRRIAVTSVAQRVAQEMRVQVGAQVGYSIRFDRRILEGKTRIKFLTDGMLLQEAISDPLLSRYSVIMVDEAHERSVNTDLLLGLLKRILRKRPTDLRIIVSSATLQSETIKSFFADTLSDGAGNDTLETDPVSLLSLEGRSFPVEIHHLSQPTDDYMERAFQTVCDIHQKEPPGDVLIFLTGKEEVNRLVGQIKDYGSRLLHGKMQLNAFPLYAGLPLVEQMDIFSPGQAGTRRVIVSTNISEASVTVDGISYVIDCGFVKIRTYNPDMETHQLVTTPISQASATQRAGRAGRTAPGKVYRLYTKASYESLSPHMVPEIQRSDLSPIILQLKAMGVENIMDFSFLSPPPIPLVSQALETLNALGVLDDQGGLTPIGEKMVGMPLEPRLAKMILVSGDLGCSQEMLSIAAMLSVTSIFIQPPGEKTEASEAKAQWAVQEGDHLTLLNVYNAYVERGKSSGKWCYRHYLNAKSLERASIIRSQYIALAKKVSLPLVSCQGRVEPILKAIASGYFDHAAQMQGDGSFKCLRNGLTLHLHPESVLFKQSPTWVVYHEVMETTRNFMRDVTAIEPTWLTEVAPHFFKKRQIQPRPRHEEE